MRRSKRISCTKCDSNERKSQFNAFAVFGQTFFPQIRWLKWLQWGTKNDNEWISKSNNGHWKLMRCEYRMLLTTDYIWMSVKYWGLVVGGEIELYGMFECQRNLIPNWDNNNIWMLPFQNICRMADCRDANTRNKWYMEFLLGHRIRFLNNNILMIICINAQIASIAKYWI